MAAAFDPAELKNLLECGICLNRFQDPRVLPCLHSYCHECLKSHISSSKDVNGTFNCPQCREKCLLPDGSVEKFPKNFFVNTMKDVLPESILQEPTLKAESSGPIMCKHHHQEGEDEHGEAVTFCVQCDAHFCQLCTKHHGMFTKDHKVTPVGNKKDMENKQPVNSYCELHSNFPINWYCKTCSLPACSECVLEKHSNHATQKLSATEAALKLDMMDVSEMAAKRIDVLQKISSEVKSTETKMEADLDKLSRDISDTADSLCKLIRQHESTLQDQLKQARQKAKKECENAEEDLHRAKDNLMRLKSQADAIQQAPSAQALSTVLQAQLTKQQYLDQQDTAVLSVEWSLEKQPSQPGKLEVSTFLGSVEFDKFEQVDDYLDTDNTSLGSPLLTTQLEYSGEQAICSVTPIYSSMLCVAHFCEKEIWIYSDGGGLQQKAHIPGIEGITGMVAVDEKAGKLALVDNKQSKVYFVSFSHDLVMQQNMCREIPIIPHRINVNPQNELVLATKEDGRIIVLRLDGMIVSDVKVLIPNDSPAIFGIQQTEFGFVMCDQGNEEVHLIDKTGHITRTVSLCSTPWHACQTSWGHTLIAENDCIIVLTEDGETVLEVNTLQCRYIMHVNEADRLMYIGHGPIGAMEVRSYKFKTCDLPLLPVTYCVNNIGVNVNLINV